MFKYFYKINDGDIIEYICDWEIDISEHPHVNEIVIEHILEEMDKEEFFIENGYDNMPKIELFDENKKSIGIYQTGVELLPSFYVDKLNVYKFTYDGNTIIYFRVNDKNEFKKLILKEKRTYYKFDMVFEALGQLHKEGYFDEPEDSHTTFISLYNENKEFIDTFKTFESKFIFVATDESYQDKKKKLIYFSVNGGEQRPYFFVMKPCIDEEDVIYEIACKIDKEGFFDDNGDDVETNFTIDIFNHKHEHICHRHFVNYTVEKTCCGFKIYECNV